MIDANDLKPCHLLRMHLGALIFILYIYVLETVTFWKQNI